MGDSIRIFYQDSLWTFEKIGIDYYCAMDEDCGVIIIYKIDPIKGTRREHLYMRSWDRVEFIYQEEDENEGEKGDKT